MRTQEREEEEQEEEAEEEEVEEEEEEKKLLKFKLCSSSAVGGDEPKGTERSSNQSTVAFGLCIRDGSVVAGTRPTSPFSWGDSI